MIIENDYLWVNGAYLFDTELAWPTLVIFSWIHWDEVSWIVANKSIYEKLINKEILLNFWRLILVVESNKEAIIQRKRFVEYNMNRLFKDWIEWDCYEIERSKELRKILDESDCLLDLHSTSWPSIPFMYAEKCNLNFAKSLWISHIIYGWDNISNWNVSWDTENYVNRNWWVWITFEAWNHDDDDWAKNSFQMILNFLSVLWMIDNKYFSNITEWKNIICIKDCYENKSWMFKYELANIDNFQFIKFWTLIWYDWQEPVIAKEDFILVMPTAEYAIKQYADVFFIWKLMNT